MEEKLKKIGNMSRSEAIEYLKKVHLSSITGKNRTDLIYACEDRIEKLDRDNAIAVCDTTAEVE